MINKDSKIYIAGHNGMVGSACRNLLLENGYENLIGKSRNELDLRNQRDVELYIKDKKPEIIINAAATVGGINANMEDPYKYLMDNILIQNNLIKFAHELNVSRFIFLGSSCIYPKNSPQPIKEEYLLTDSLEETNQWYAIAKIAGVKLCEAIFKKYNKQFISLMPTNLYGPKDNFDLKTSHVLPALIRRFHEANENNEKEVVLWGDGSPLREFLNSYDLAKAILFVCENHLDKHIYNVGSGDEFSIKEIALKVKDIIGFSGNIKWNSSMPNGTKRKLLDSSKLNDLGWNKTISIDSGIKSTYQWYLITI